MAHILVVDDSATDRHAFRKILEKNGHTVTVANNGSEGLQLAKRISPDLILMDVVMPELNGFQATRELSRTESTRNIPVIMVTTKDGESDMLWAKRQGARAYLVKPPSERQLLGCIGDLLGSGK